MARCVSLVVLVAVLLAACAPATKQTGTVLYTSDDIGFGQLKQGGLGILPVSAIEEMAGYRRATGVFLEQSFKKVLRKIHGVSAASNAIAEAELSAEYSEFIDDYAKSSILNKEVLTKLGDAIGVRYLLYSHLQTFSAEKGLFLGEPVTRRTVEIYGQVWDTKTGQILWEGIGKGKSGETTVDRPATFEELAPKACDELVKGIVIK